MVIIQSSGKLFLVDILSLFIFYNNIPYINPVSQLLSIGTAKHLKWYILFQKASAEVGCFSEYFFYSELVHN